MLALESQLLAIRESLTAASHVMNPRLLQVKLRLSSGQQTDGLLKVAQLGKAEGKSPQHVGFQPRRKPTEREYINRRFRGGTQGTVGVAPVCAGGDERDLGGGGYRYCKLWVG